MNNKHDFDLKRSKKILRFHETQERQTGISNFFSATCDEIIH